MIYAQAFFDLQLRFADTVAALAGMPRERALLAYTNLYVRFGLGRDFDPAHPTWREYLAGLHDAGDPGGWTYRFYLRRPDAVSAPGLVATFGCFSYAQHGEDRIRLHFRNAEANGHSPLGIARIAERRADLTALFAHVERARRGPLRVMGTSWLYNLEAYRRLFPAAYVATAKAVGPRFQRMPLWGQFLDRRGTVRDGVRREFLERLDRQASLEGLEQCFPLPPLGVEAPVREFYDFYGI